MCGTCLKQVSKDLRRLCCGKIMQGLRELTMRSLLWLFGILRMGGCDVSECIRLEPSPQWHVCACRCEQVEAAGKASASADLDHEGCDGKGQGCFSGTALLRRPAKAVCVRRLHFRFAGCLLALPAASNMLCREVAPQTAMLMGLLHFRRMRVVWETCGGAATDSASTEGPTCSGHTELDTVCSTLSGHERHQCRGVLRLSDIVRRCSCMIDSR